jgi:hypothetical protein
MLDLKSAASEAAKIGPQPRRTGFMSEVEEAFEQITDAIERGATFTSIAKRGGVPPKRLIEAYRSIERKRAGLTARGKPRQRGPGAVLVSPGAAAFRPSAAPAQSQTPSTPTAQPAPRGPTLDLSGLRPKLEGPKASEAFLREFGTRPPESQSLDPALADIADEARRKREAGETIEPEVKGFKNKP